MGGSHIPDDGKPITVATGHTKGFTMVEIALRDSKTGLLRRDLLRYTPAAARVEIRNLTKAKMEFALVDPSTGRVIR